MMADEPKQTEKTDAEQAAEDGASITSIHVKVYSPFQVYFDNAALSITAENETGSVPPVLTWLNR